MASKYNVSVGAKLDLTELNKDFSTWKQKNNKITLDVEGNVTKTMKTLVSDIGEVAKVSKTAKSGITTITDETAKWKTQQDLLRQKIELSTQKLEAMKQQANGISNTWGQNSSGIQNITDRITSLQNQYTSLINSNQTLDSATLQRLNNERTGIQQSISMLNQQTNATNTATTSVMSLAAQWLSIQKVISETIQLIRNMVDAVFELDASLTELSKVSSISKDNLSGIVDQAYEIGEKVAATGTQVVDAVTNFKRAGYELNESLDLGEAALTMKNIADGIDTVDEATTTIISTMKGFNLTVNDTEHILSSMNNVANNTASTYSGLADVMQRSSAVMSQAGNSMEETIGLAAGMMEILGADKSESIARGLNSITQRLRGITSLGEDGFEGVSKLNKELERLGTKYGTGASIFDNNGNLRSTFDIMSDIAELYPKMTENERQYIAIQSSGKTQVANFSAAMQNWQGVINATDLALNSAGSAAKENAIFQESLQGQLNSLSSAFQKLATDSINSGFVSAILKATTGIINFTNAIGGLPTIITSVTFALMAMNATKITTFFTQAASGVSTFIYSMSMGKTATEAFAIATNQATAATTALKIAQGGLIALGVAGVIWATKTAFDALNQTVAEQEQKVNNLKNNYSELESTISNLKGKTDLTDGEREYLGILEMQLSVQKEQLEVEERLLAIKKATGEGEWFSSGALGDLNGKLAEATNYINEYNTAIEVSKDVSGDAFEGCATAATNAKDALRELYTEMTNSYNTLEEALPYAEGEDLVKIQNAMDSYSALIPILKEMGIGAREASNGVSTLGESASTSSQAVLELKDGIKELSDITSDIVDEINLLNGAIATQSAGMSLSADEVDRLLQRYPELQTQISLTEDGYRINIQALEDLRVKSIDSFNQEIEGSRQAAIQVVNDCRTKITSIKAEIVALQELQSAWAKMSPLLGNSSTANIVGFTDPYTQGINTLNDSLDSEVNALEEAIEALNSMGAESKRVEIATGNLANEITSAQEKADKAAKAGKKTIKDYADDFDDLGKTIKDAIDDLTSLEKSFYLFKQGRVNEAFAEQKMSLEEINEEMYTCRGTLSKLLADYEKYSKVTTGDEAKKNLDKLNDSIKEQQTLLKELTSQAKAYNEELKRAASTQLKSEVAAFESLISSVVTLLKEDLNAEKDRYQDIIDSLKERYDAEVDELEKMVDAKKEAINDELDALKESYETRKKLAKAEHDAVVGKLKDELSTYQDIINKRKELLDKQEDERTYQENLAELNKELADLEFDLLNAQLDDSLEGKKKEKEIEEALAKKKKEIWELQNAWKIEQEKAALDAELEAKTEALEKEIEETEDAYDKESEALEDMFDKKEQELKDDLKYWEKYLESQKESLKSSLDSQVAEYQGYIKNIEQQLKEEGTLRLQAIAELENANSTLYDKLIAYEEKYGEGITKNIIDKWDLATEALRKYTNLAGIKDAEGMLDSDDWQVGEDNKVESSNNSSSSNPSSTNSNLKAERENLQKYYHNLMLEANSSGNQQLANWVKTERKKNQFNPDTGADEYVYHQGGIAGGDDKANLKSTEIFARLMKGEPVVTESQANDFMTKTLPTLMGVGTSTTSNNNNTNYELNFNINGNVDNSTIIALKQYVDKGLKALDNTINAQRKGYKVNATQYSL